MKHDETMKCKKRSDYTSGQTQMVKGRKWHKIRNETAVHLITFGAWASASCWKRDEFALYNAQHQSIDKKNFLS